VYKNLVVNNYISNDSNLIHIYDYFIITCQLVLLLWVTQELACGFPEVFSAG